MNLPRLLLPFFAGILLLFSCHTSVSQTPFANYDSLKSTVQQGQRLFNAAYAKAPAHKKDSVLTAARDSVFTTILHHYFGFWYGTPWDFYGATRTPQKGKIACGYFVTTVLEDAGFKIPRVKWAQVASETMILGMTKDVKRFRNRPVAEVQEYIEKRGKGLYVAGLDNHTGFIVNNGEEVLFVHANYYQPQTGVMAQKLDNDNPLKNSKYRVVGKILDDEMMRCWITGKKME